MEKGKKKKKAQLRKETNVLQSKILNKIRKN
jgi:hypothetical protein